ncbi:DUF2515 family protein [Massilia norwichensis]|uniref:GNAT family N-acetyltransferase n=1 Tax=Massilia norwichensis TaxID=1442366 RepID=A0ABT2AB51_9BURK|nr:hypothetical protein [Massilia norwichensis]MCS0591431.1 hypothetical protein [Massilia norwichensis]
MNALIAPVTSTPSFAPNRYHGIPIGALAPSGETLTPELLWASFQLEAEDLLKIDGRWIGDDRERNRRINTAYARLWLADQRFQWAGLAAFASKQVGCGLLHSAEIVDARRREREAIDASIGHGSAPGVQYGATMKQLATEMAGSSLARRLGHGNTHVFLDIYPLHRFYMERGWEAFRACLPHRQLARYAVRWDVDRGTLPFAASFPEVLRGFEQIENGRIADSVRTQAQHEQVNILQKIMYDAPVMQLLLDWNQLAWATDFPSGDYQAIELSLSAQCPAPAGTTTTFSKARYAKLWDASERMPFVFAAAEQLDALLAGPEGAQVEASIRMISGGALIA